MLTVCCYLFVVSPLPVFSHGLCRAQRVATRGIIAEVQPKLKAVISQTKTVQGEVEQSISVLYKGRKVNIIGDINIMN